MLFRSGGNRGVEPNWGPVLRSWGYATFVLDSFRRRGLAEVCTNGPALVPLQRVPDAYGALRLLAAHPAIDPERIALMGFSHGGALTMLASTAWAKERYAPQLASWQSDQAARQSASNQAFNRAWDVYTYSHPSATTIFNAGLT